MLPALQWPKHRQFAFTIFDDPDSQTLAANRAVYDLLKDLGFRTTIGAWPNPANHELRSDPGETCANPQYVERLLSLKEVGFEIGFHNATSHTSLREQTQQGLDRFAQLFGHDPVTMANHYNSNEGIYWAEDRLSGLHRTLYTALTRGRYRGQFTGHVPGSAEFWGDLCQSRIRYVRNFVFGEINTLKACPWMPYYDPARPYVNHWYAGSEGAQAPEFVRMLREENQDTLEAEGGCCIMYTHFGLGYESNGRLDPRFVKLMTRLAKKNGWFVPVHVLLDEIQRQRGPLTITPADRRHLERRWLWHKIRYGSA
jgi:hypothetical protein